MRSLRSLIQQSWIALTRLLLLLLLLPVRKQHIVLKAPQIHLVNAEVAARRRRLTETAGAGGSGCSRLLQQGGEGGRRDDVHVGNFEGVALDFVAQVAQKALQPRDRLQYSIDLVIAAINILNRPRELCEYVILNGCIRGAIDKIIRCCRGVSLVV